MLKQHGKLIVDFTKQVDAIYKYMHWCYKQKHKILKEFDLNEDFVIDDEVQEEVD